jgi:type VI secretion system secreted protein Hcp
VEPPRTHRPNAVDAWRRAECGVILAGFAYEENTMKRLALVTVLTATAISTASAAPKSTIAPESLRIADKPSVIATRNTITLTATGAQSGAITAGNEAPLTCVRFSHSIVSPRDAASGLPTGKRMHKPLICTTRNVSKGILRLFKVLTQNENLKSAVFTATGSDTSVLKLSNANVASIESRSDDSGLYFDIAFTYQKIEWTKEGVTFSDDWEAPTA